MADRAPEPFLSPLCSWDAFDEPLLAKVVHAWANVRAPQQRAPTWGRNRLPYRPLPQYTELMAIKKPSKASPAEAAKVKVVDSKRAMASLQKIRERDAELLKRLSR